MFGRCENCCIFVSTKTNNNLIYINMKTQNTKRNKKETAEKLVFWSIVGIYGTLFLYGLFQVLNNFGSQSFNF